MTVASTSPGAISAEISNPLSGRVSTKHPLLNSSSSPSMLCSSFAKSQQSHIVLAAEGSSFNALRPDLQPQQGAWGLCVDSKSLLFERLRSGARFGLLCGMKCSPPNPTPVSELLLREASEEVIPRLRTSPVHSTSVQSPRKVQQGFRHLHDPVVGRTLM